MAFLRLENQELRETVKRMESKLDRQEFGAVPQLPGDLISSPASTIEAFEELSVKIDQNKRPYVSCFRPMILENVLWLGVIQI